MRKSKKQMVMAAAACAMMGVMVIGGTMAYLTDSETATNTFTIGQVKIDLEEPEYAKLTDTQKKNLVPNQIVAKDPQVENTGVNDAIVFLKVEMPKKDVIVAEKDGTRKTTAVTELFTMLNTDIDPAAGADQLRRQPRVVAVEVGAENVQPVPVHVRLRQLALHGLAAGLLAEARVDQQAPLSGQQIAVQVFQRVPHQGDVQPPEVLRQSLRHGPLPFQKVDSV